MKQILKYIIFTSLVFLSPIQVMGQKVPSGKLDFESRFMVQFPTNRADINPSYRDNYYAIEELKRFFNTIDISNVDSLSIMGSSSPDGSAGYNQDLAFRRAISLRDMISRFIPGSLSKIYVHAKGDTWPEMLSLIRRDDAFPIKEYTLVTLQNALPYADRLKALKYMDYSDSYEYLKKYILPSLRNAMAVAIYYKGEEKFLVFDNEQEYTQRNSFVVAPVEVPQLKGGPQTTTSTLESPQALLASAQNSHKSGSSRKANKNRVEDPMTSVIDNSASSASSTPIPSTSTTPSVATSAIPSAAASSTTTTTTPSAATSTSPTSSTSVLEMPYRLINIKSKRPVVAIKSNLLYDVASALNLELEVPLGNRWSILGEAIAPWWLWSNKQICLQVFSAHIEGRVWFGKREPENRLLGWFMGVYAGGGYYDIEWQNKGYQGESLLSVGLTAGYAHSIAKNLRMEYSIGVGYLDTHYREYQASLNSAGRWNLDLVGHGQSRWIGPTKAKVSLVWVINKGR